MIEVELPWPPSVNTYYRRKGSVYFITQKGIKFRNDVAFICAKHKNKFNKEARLSLSLIAYPPDRRRRDLDNLLKSTVDSLEKAQIFVDDSQIDKLTVIRKDKLESKIIVRISEIFEN